MQIKSINNYSIRNFCGLSQANKIENKTNENTEVFEYSYSSNDLKQLKKDYELTDYSLFKYDFDMEKKDKSSAITVNGKKIQGYAAGHDIDLKLSTPRFDWTRDLYRGTIDDKPVVFTCRVKNEGHFQYGLQYENTEDLESLNKTDLKQILDVLSVQRDKRIQDTIFATENVRI